MFTRAQIKSIVENIALVTGQATLVNQTIQIALSRLYQYHDWPYYLDFKNGVITTNDDYVTGTIDVTNGSTAVTGNSTVWTSAMVDRKIRVSSERPYYRIASINTGAQTLVLDRAYQGDTGTAQGYAIFQDEYRLNPDVDKYKSFRQIQNGIMMLDLFPKNFDEIYVTPTVYADPFYAMDVGNDIEIYSTGTLSATGTTITGAGSPAWTSVEGLGKGSKIRIGTAAAGTWYTVRSVDSATQITTYETFPSTVAAGTTYEIPLNNIIVQLYPIPNASRHLYYRYFRIPTPLANDPDLPDMPYDYHHVLIWGALSELWSQKGDQVKADQYELRFINGLNQMKLKIGSFAPDRISQRKSSDRAKRAKVRGIEPPSYDLRYSW